MIESSGSSGADALDVFLLPGLGVRSTSVSQDENPELIALHRVLSGFGDVKILLHMPDIDQPSARCMGIEGVIDGLVERLSGVARSAVVVGYSTGGYLAFEACRRLAKAGASVRLLLMIDSSAFFVPSAPSSLTDEIVQSARAGLAKTVVSAPFLVAMRCGKLELARRWLLGVRHISGRSRCPEWRLRLLIAYWLKAIERLHLQPYEGQIVLLKASRGRPRIVDSTLGWGPLAPSLKVGVVDGDHWTMLRSPDLVHQVFNELSRVGDAYALTSSE